MYLQTWQKKIYRKICKKSEHKYNSILKLDIKRHISGFDHKSKIHLSDIIDESFLLLHRKNTCLDLWHVTPDSYDKVNYLAQIIKKVIILL